MDDLSVILLAGGVGCRFCGVVPKQFVDLCGKPLALHSFALFQQLPVELVVVVAAEYRHLFGDVLFANPGARRQDSMANGLQRCSREWILVHDSARPFVSRDMVERLYQAAQETGAATTGMPITATVKQVGDRSFVEKTLDRTRLWEIQTPQMVHRSLLLKGLALQKEVTDDVSLAELVGCPVRVIEGSRRNLKVTSPEDLLLARVLHAL